MFLSFISGVYNFSSSSLTAANCIFWNNSADGETDEFYNSSAEVIMSYCNVSGGCSGIADATCGDGNINQDPRFFNASIGRYDLSEASPCIDSGNSSSLPADVSDLDSDENTGENIPYDIAGNDREIDGNGDGTSVTDMGAFEYLPKS